MSNSFTALDFGSKVGTTAGILCYEHFARPRTASFSSNGRTAATIMNYGINQLFKYSKLGYGIAGLTGMAGTEDTNLYYDVSASRFARYVYACLAFASADSTKTYFSFNFMGADPTVKPTWFSWMDDLSEISTTGEGSPYLGNPTDNVAATRLDTLETNVYGRDFDNYYVIANLNDLYTIPPSFPGQINTAGIKTVTYNSISYKLSGNSALFIPKGYGGPYYVDPTGDNLDDGSIYTPWATLTHAASWVRDSGAKGSTIYVRQGRYQEKVTISGLKADGASWYKILKYPDDTGAAIFDCNGGGEGITDRDGEILIHYNNNGILISGLKVVSSNSHGFCLFGGEISGVKITHCEIYNCSSSGIYAYSAEAGSQGEYVRNVEFCYNTLRNVNDGPAYGGAPATSPQEAISFSNVQVFNIHHNTLSNFGKEGIDAKSGTKSGSIHHNYISANRTTGYFNWDYDHVCVYVDGYSSTVKRIDVYNNFMTGWGGNGVAIGAENPNGVCAWCNVYNNVISVRPKTGYGVVNGIVVASVPESEHPGEGGNSYISGVRIYSNSIYCSATPIKIDNNASPYISGLRIYNNSCYGTGYSTLYVTRLTPAQSANRVSLFNNVYFTTYNESNPRSYWAGEYPWTSYPEKFGVGAQMGNPLYIDSGSNLHILNSSSPLVSSASMDLITLLDYDDHPRLTQGDVGAYELAWGEGEGLPPTALFDWTPQNPNIEQTVTFDASDSYYSENPIIFYEWDWDNDSTYEDGSASATMNHSWTTAGTYTVTLRVTDSESLTDTYTDNITIYDLSPEYWYDTQWPYRKKISIDGNYISGTHTNFPFFCRISGISISQHASSNGRDIIFTDFDMVTRIPHEIDTWDSYSGTIWVRLPYIAHSSNKDIYCYYGNPQGGNQTDLHGYRPSSVWDDSFVFVCHMNDSGSRKCFDSSMYQNKIGKASSNLTHDLSLPQMARSALFRNWGSSQLLQSKHHFYLSSNYIPAYGTVTSQATLSVWFQHFNMGGENDPTYGPYSYNWIVSISDHLRSQGARPMLIYYKASCSTEGHTANPFNDFVISTQRGDIDSDPQDGYYHPLQIVDGGLASGAIQFLALTHNATLPMTGYYKNAEARWTMTTDVYDVGNLTNPGIIIGNNAYTRTRGGSGQIDEIRYAKKARTRGWLVTEWNNISSMNLFSVMSDEEVYTPTEIDEGVTSAVGFFCGAGNLTFLNPERILYIYRS